MKHGAAPLRKSVMPTTKQRISINLEDGEYAELSALAEKHNISMAWIGRKAILDLLERNRKDPLQLPLSFAERGERPAWLNTGSR
jgi:predicted transcriptional regulator